MSDPPPDLREPETPAPSEAESEVARLRWRALKHWYRAQRGLEVALIFPVAAGVFLSALVQGTLREGTPSAEWMWDPRRAGGAFLLLYLLGLLVVLLAAYVAVRLRVGRELKALGAVGVNPARALMALEQPGASQRRLQREAELLQKPRWLVELSGAHLVWWTALALLAWSSVHPLCDLDALEWSPPAACNALCNAVGPLLAVGGIGFLFKLVVPLALLRQSDRRDLALFYRWWSGWTWPVVIALAPGIVHVILTALGVKVT